MRFFGKTGLDLGFYPFGQQIYNHWRPLTTYLDH